jgi:cytochrome P450
MTDRFAAAPLRGVKVWSTMAKFIGDPIPVLQSLHDRYGSTVAFPNNPFQQLDPRLYVMAFGPQYNEQILTNPEIFRARGLVLQGPPGSAHQIVRFGLISMNGEQHRRHRALLMPAFHRRAIDGYRDRMAELTIRLVEQWRAGETRDIARDMRTLALDVASMVLFGYSEQSSYRPLGRLIEHWMAESFSPNVWFLQWDLPGFPYRRLLRLAEELDREVRRMLGERRKASLQGDDVISMLLRAHDQDPDAMPEDELVGEVSVLFTAAHETNTVALTWTLFLLSQHPKILSDLLDELGAVLHGDAPRIDQFERLPLLEWVIKESLRILPPVGWSTRAVDQATRLGPYDLAKGSRVLFSQYITHHMPDIFPNPRSFSPQRWSSAAPPPYAFIPFGGGPRLCIGYAFSMTFLRIALAVILQKFGLSLAPGTKIDRAYQITMAPKDGMPMVLHGAGERIKPVRPQGTIHDMVQLDG